MIFITVLKYILGLKAPWHIVVEFFITGNENQQTGLLVGVTSISKTFPVINLSNETCFLLVIILSKILICTPTCYSVSQLY